MSFTEVDTGKFFESILSITCPQQNEVMENFTPFFPLASNQRNGRKENANLNQSNCLLTNFNSSESCSRGRSHEAERARKIVKRAKLSRALLSLGLVQPTLRLIWFAPWSCIIISNWIILLSPKKPWFNRNLQLTKWKKGKIFSLTFFHVSALKKIVC